MPVIFKFEPIPGPTADWEDTELYVRVPNIFCLICGYWDLKSPNLAHIIPRKHGKFKKAVGSHTTKPNWEDTFRLIIDDTKHRGCYLSCSQASEMFRDDLSPSYLKALLHLMKEFLSRKPWKNLANRRRRRSERQCFGFAVHSCCWELLKTHRLKAMAETGLATLVAALQRQWMVFQISYDYAKNPPSKADPFYTPSVFDTIYAEVNEAEWYRKQAAGKATNKRHALQHVDQAGLRALPFELIYMIAEYLPSQEARSLEKILDLRLGILFWRPKISLDLFYEVKAVTRGDIHWGRLFSKLQDLEKSDALVLRRKILGCLDEHLDKIELDKQRAKQTGI